MPRAGLTRERVVAAAAAIVDDEGIAALTLTRLADRLGVRPPSLYNHVDGLDGLVGAVAIAAVRDLGETCRAAAMGREGPAAMRRVAHAYRNWGKAHPGIYRLTQTVRPDDEEWERYSRRLVEAVLAILAGYGLEGDDAVHAVRVLRSALHGFVLLELDAGFGLALDVDQSFSHLLDLLDRTIAADRGLRPSGSKTLD